MAASTNGTIEHRLSPSQQLDYLSQQDREMIVAIERSFLAGSHGDGNSYLTQEPANIASKRTRLFE